MKLSDREKLIDRLVDNDINDIWQGLENNDTEFLERVLRGDGFIQYNYMSLDELLREYAAREFLMEQNG